MKDKLIIRFLLVVILSVFIAGNVDAQEEKSKKRKDEFKVMAGINFNHLNIDENYFSSSFTPGFQLGASYKRGKFFYWELGVEYDNSIYQLEWNNAPDTVSWFDGLFSVRSVEIPVTFGTNVLSLTSRLAGLRVFIGVDPSFQLGIGKNDIGISLEDLNSFIMKGRLGAGLDVAFIFLEAGFQYGFTDLLENDIKSKPMQVYLNLGFRF